MKVLIKPRDQKDLHLPTKRRANSGCDRSVGGVDLPHPLEGKKINRKNLHQQEMIEPYIL